MSPEILTKITVDCSTGIETIEPLTAEELAQREVDRIAYEAAEVVRVQAEADAQALKDSANAKLAALGLTADEIAAITR